AAPRQLSLIDESMALAELPIDPGADYGEVFTRRWVVDLILDLVGYTPDKDLAAQRLVEPSCGTGAFLVPVVDRLIASSQSHGRPLTALAGAIRAFDLAETWVTTGDFLLADHEPRSAAYVVGNPPYIRLENVRSEVMEAYRRRCVTMRGRSDIYVGFIEVGLELLEPDGALGFICADRWMRNQYGADLCGLVTGSYAVDTVLTMHDVDAFEDEVSAYPAVVVLRNEVQGRAFVAAASAQFGPTDAAELVTWSREPKSRALELQAVEASTMDRWFDGGDLWPSGSPGQLALIADLEARFPPLEDSTTGTRVGIGVATGCDGVYITDDADLVEEDRLLPLLQAGDIATGQLAWSGRYLVNPWDENGLVALDRHPRLAEHFAANGDRLRSRHVARVRPHQWYRTIDRVHSDLQGRPKLLLPDIKAAAHPVLDDGRFYPHHNLYFVVSDQWDLEVLGGLLLSDLANLFVGAYCVKMRGGCYRFQAQYVRRIRVPAQASIARADRRALAEAFRARDIAEATAVACKVYGITA